MAAKCDYRSINECENGWQKGFQMTVTIMQNFLHSLRNSPAAPSET